MRKPVVGEDLFAVWIGGSKLKAEQKEVTVTKVGRKYFYVSDLVWDPRFRIETWREDNNIGHDNWKLYESEQKYLDENELILIGDELRRIFGGYGIPKITLDQARRIKVILDERN